MLNTDVILLASLCAVFYLINALNRIEKAIKDLTATRKTDSKELVNTINRKL
jgi:hypothetical protein